MEDIRKLVEEVLNKGYLMSLATVDDGGPWVSDVIYVHDDQLNIWWISMPQTRHSKAILADARVAATITVSTELGEPNLGLQISGTAERVEGDDLARATKHRTKRGKPAPSREGELIADGHVWYRLKPTKIQLIYEPLFAREKKSLDL